MAGADLLDLSVEYNDEVGEIEADCMDGDVEGCYLEVYVT